MYLFRKQNNYRLTCTKTKCVFILPDNRLSCLNHLSLLCIPLWDYINLQVLHSAMKNHFHATLRSETQNLRLTLCFPWVIEICLGWRRGPAGVWVSEERLFNGMNWNPRPRSDGLHSKQASWRRSPHGFMDQHCMHLIIFQRSLGFFSGIWPQIVFAPLSRRSGTGDTAPPTGTKLELETAAVLGII